MSNTPRRTVRVPDNLWRAAKASAEARGDTLTLVIQRALERYVEQGNVREREHA